MSDTDRLVRYVISIVLEIERLLQQTMLNGELRPLRQETVDMCKAFGAESMAEQLEREWRL